MVAHFVKLSDSEKGVNNNAIFKYQTIIRAYKCLI
jgi:hypothetical protein